MTFIFYFFVLTCRKDNQLFIGHDRKLKLRHNLTNNALNRMTETRVPVHKRSTFTREGTK